VLLLTGDDVRALLPMTECMEVVEEALGTLARGEGANPLRSALPLPDGTGLLGVMPGWLASPRGAGIKVITVMPGNHGTPYDSHQGVVLVFESEHGRPAAVIDASSVTAIRTAAASGVATRALARDDVHTLALIGTGVEAATHLEAMLAVRAFTEVRVAGRSAERAREFAESAASTHGVTLRVAGSAREAVEGADVICTVTSSATPVVDGAWLASGCHVNAVGACTPKARELDTEAVRRARLFADSRESVLNESGDFLLARVEGAITDDHIVAELGDVLLGRDPGRRSPDEITMFESLGIAVEDVAVGQRLLAKARAAGVGVEMDLGGRRT
jgi:alanine dehydrogenase